MGTIIWWQIISLPWFHDSWIVNAMIQRTSVFGRSHIFFLFRVNNKSNWHFDFSKIPIHSINLIRCVRFFVVCFLSIFNYRIEKQFLYMFKLNFILCLRWKTLILWAARRFRNKRYAEQWHGIHLAMVVVYAMHTPTDRHSGPIPMVWIYDLFYFISFYLMFKWNWSASYGRIDVSNRCGNMSTPNSFSIYECVQSKCEMLFMFSSNVCLCGHFYSILRQ